MCYLISQDFCLTSVYTRAASITLSLARKARVPSDMMDGMCAALVQPYCVYNMILIQIQLSLQNVPTQHTALSAMHIHSMQMQRRESGGQERCSADRQGKATQRVWPGGWNSLCGFALSSGCCLSGGVYKID
jgi:hypothetical protein